jgi:pyruvate dehydrogenase E2 component (dihydrolipoamide acetyltransferase)
VIRDAQSLAVDELGSQIGRVAAGARARELGPGEMRGSTFTISNLGMLDVDHFTAILNPPEVGILAIGALRQAPAVDDGRIVIRPQMTVTLVCDHRAIDGADAARFLAGFAGHLARADSPGCGMT